MRLFWKLFCSTVLITVLACSLGGYFLIDSFFRSSLEREVTAVYEENDLLRYTLGREMDLYFPSVTKEDVATAASRLTITTSRGTVAFRLSDQDGNQLSGSGTLPMDSAMTAKLEDGQRGWELRRGWGSYYIHAASPLAIGGGTLYLENCRKVGELFLTREEQYRTFFYLMLGLVAAVGLVSLSVSVVMLRPLGRLSAATKRMAAGELSERVAVKGDDELSQLSADFNVMAARLEAQVEELKAAARRQEDFLNSFAHETKTPLTSIIGYADLLRSRPASPEQVRQSASYIFNEGRRMESLSRKLMDLIVLEKQDFVLRESPMDAFLERVGGVLRPALEKQGIRLRLRAKAALVPIEPDLMETVCLNLLDNARKAISGPGLILLEGIEEEGGYCIRVTDTGKGIPPEDLSRVTEAFYMVDKSRARAQGGAGMGLAVCRKIVALHGGAMEFRSIVGQGTQVRVHLKGGGGA
ncbi:HAMP domain-containing histidine kinase [Oscillibacter sp. MSJ-2]|uniref:histidine kinase n=1 Tax=Dysosmobacter acutus TaxID=2841504 RepID=A0ABS6F9H9_9FIRM|nr:HAMP domain-containing sensor histidine kinase [Dysosmobacter acutus]MBU5626939.1 HAMP domain-containing histidine kinase [Dysosmobacter acutus]